MHRIPEVYRLRTHWLKHYQETLRYYRNDREHIAYRYAGIDGKDDGTPADFFCFMFSESGMGVVKDLASQLVNDTMNEREKVLSALTFVQSLPYSKDEDSKQQEEYVRYPVETLADGTGDCEDKAVLLGAVLQEVGVDFVLLLLPDHVALGVCCEADRAASYVIFGNKKYYYLETTALGWGVGQIPEEYLNTMLEVCPVNTHPTLIVKKMHFESDPTPVFRAADCMLELDLYNLGPHAITGLKLYVMDQLFILDDLAEGEERSQTVRFKCLIDKKSELQIAIIGDDIPEQYVELKLDHHQSEFPVPVPK